MNSNTFTARLIRATNRPTVRKLVADLIRHGETRTGHYTGSGKRTTAHDNTPDVLTALRTMGIEATTGNDAPRGGVTGNWVKLTPKGKQSTAHVRADMKATEQAAAERANNAKDKAQQAAAEQAAQLMADVETLRPFAQARAAEILASKQLAGQAKSDRQQAIMSSIVTEANHSPANFWKTWAIINNVNA